MRTYIIINVTTRDFEVVCTGVKFQLFDVYLKKKKKKLQFTDFLCKFATSIKLITLET